MNVLAIAAHFDDVELGCAGTLINHVAAGDRTAILVATDSGYRNPQGKTVRDPETAAREGRAAAAIIGAELLCLNRPTFSLQSDEDLTAQLIAEIEKRGIDTIYTHWVHDVHRDHRNLARAALMAGRHVPRFLMFRSNFYDSDAAFKGNFYTDISGVMERKLSALSAHASELSRVGYSWLELTKYRNAADGQKVGASFAECFEVIRYCVPV